MVVLFVILHLFEAMLLLSDAILTLFLLVALVAEPDDLADDGHQDRSFKSVTEHPDRLGIGEGRPMRMTANVFR